MGCGGPAAVRKLRVLGEDVSVAVDFFTLAALGFISAVVMVVVFSRGLPSTDHQ